jgi:DNA-binding NarL/FixJ family response regulator
MPDESASSSMIHVLLVDDHDILRQGLKMLLSMQQGIKVVGEARTGQEAIVMAKELMPDVVVMDITMPNMDGLEACQLIRNQQPATQVLILTMHESEEYFLQALRMGAAGYLVKKAEGYTNQEIADQLTLSIKTVQAHRANLMEKLDLRDITHLVRFAVRYGLIPPEP